MTEAVMGLAALSKKLEGIQAETAAKMLRSAAFSATLPTFRKIQAAAPVGTRPHRTYKGRLVAPGFLKRSLRRKSWMKGGKATVAIGVRREAFYGIAFLDRGTKKFAGHKDWFVSVFESDSDNIVRTLNKRLSSRIMRHNKRVKK